jgi:Mrp family chromosome partitioning ATPase/capsular polysaccharide biosynthesis protein
VERHAGYSLQDYLRVIRRRKWIIIQAAILVPLAAALFSLHQPKLYQSGAEVLISRQNLANALNGVSDPTLYTDPNRLTQTQATLARVPEVARRALASLGLKRPPGALLQHSSVTSASNSDILTFRVTDRSPALAAKLTTAYAKQFTLYRQELDTVSLNKAINEVRSRINELASAGDRRSALYASLVEKEQQLATIAALETGNITVVKPATGATQIQPKPVRNAIIGLVLGLVFGIALAFLEEALDTRVRTAGEIGERLGLPLLARVPEPPRSLGKEDRLVMVGDPRSLSAEPFRMLRTNLDFVRMGDEIRTLLITSSVKGEGKSTTAANLAVALANGGQHVALVDLDLRSPFLDRFFAVGRHPGLTQVVIGHATLEEALVNVPLREPTTGNLPAASNGSSNMTAGETGGPAGSLKVIVAGPVPPNAGEFVSSPALGWVVAELRRRFDVVIFDAPPMLRVGDAMALSRHIDGLVIVTRLKVVRRAMLNELKRQLDASPATKLGFVVTGAQEEDDYGYGYGYGYGYEYGSTPRERVSAS